MTLYVYSPIWFYGIDSFFEFIFLFITGLIGLYSLYIYRLSRQKKYKYFGLSFLLMGISYFLLSITNLAIYFKLLENTFILKKIQDITILYQVGFLTHILLMLSAYLILISICLKIRDKRIISLLFLLVLLSILTSNNQYLMFFVIGSILLSYIIYHQYKNYLTRRSRSALLVFLAFSCILLSQVMLLLVLYNKVFYVVGYLFQLIGYLILFADMVVVLTR